MLGYGRGTHGKGMPADKRWATHRGAYLSGTECLARGGDCRREACADFAAFSSPEAFIFFGGMAKAGDLIMNPIKKSYDEHVLKIFKGKAQFLFSGLDGSSAAVLGASAVGWDI